VDISYIQLLQQYNANTNIKDAHSQKKEEKRKNPTELISEAAGTTTTNGTPRLQGTP
jgi:hypothetical protein